MEVSENYTNLIERAEKIALREGQGLRMLSDTFDSDWKPGDEPHGTMVFTDKMPLAPPPARNLLTEIDALTIRVAELEVKKPK